MVLKGAGYYQNIHIDNTAGKWRVAGSIYENTLVFDPASGTLHCANVTANVTDINDHIVQSWTDGTGWWKKYKSGWVEQGGYSSAGNGAAGITTVFTYRLPIVLIPSKPASWAPAHLSSTWSVVQIRLSTPIARDRGAPATIPEAPCPGMPVGKARE